jgi:hypothetical protein
MTPNQKPVERWLTEFRDIMVNFDNKNPHEWAESVEKWLTDTLSHQKALSRAEGYKEAERKTAYDIVELLDNLEIKQPEDLKTDNWRNWKYIRNSIVDKYDILGMWKNTPHSPTLSDTLAAVEEIKSKDGI